uniref:TMBIM4 protein n=1 Tax=Homo sapiens TaxID=9606 RepID=Q7Z782_HUMAN
MADPDPRYPRSSIEDDFNYGSSVASATVHIRMGSLNYSDFNSFFIL